VSVRPLLNPAAGRRRGERRRALLRDLASAAGVEFEESASAEDLTRRARRARDERVERLLVAGGDGTQHWAMRGLAGGDTAQAPIPLGTGNDFARELGYPLAPEAAFGAALAGERRRIDLGRLDGHPFCVIAGVGFDAAVAAYARTRVRWLRGPLVYAWATLATLAGFRPPRVSLQSDGGEFSGEVFFVAFANCSHYGGGMRVAPAADPQDGLLDIVVVRRVAKARLLAIFPRVYRGSHVGHPAVRVLRASSATLHVEPPQPVNIDGEGFGRSGSAPLRLSLEPRALPVIQPELH